MNILVLPILDCGYFFSLAKIQVNLPSFSGTKMSVKTEANSPSEFRKSKTNNTKTVRVKKEQPLITKYTTKLTTLSLEPDYQGKNTLNQARNEIKTENKTEITDSHPTEPLQNDIGLLKPTIPTMTDIVKYDSIRNIWRPNEGYQFRVTEYKGKKTSCNFSWFKNYEWLVYSPMNDSVYCLHCLMFPNISIKGTNLVSTGIKFWRSATSKLKSHNDSTGHKQSTLQFEGFITTRKNPEKAINRKLNKQEALLIRNNRDKMLPMIMCVEYLGKQNIALRGHRDDSANYDGHGMTLFYL